MRWGTLVSQSVGGTNISLAQKMKFKIKCHCSDNNYFKKGEGGVVPGNMMVDRYNRHNSYITDTQIVIDRYFYLAVHMYCCADAK